MKTPRIEMVDIDRLRPNPFRNLATYPWIEEKIAALIASYKDIGVFEGLIARPAADGDYEQWFGHHRVEAARRAGIKVMPVIIRDATDEDMIKAMARENGEDFATDFLIQLNTWEGGLQYFSSAGRPKNPEALEVARLLGMTSPDEKGAQGDRMDHTARACDDAHQLIEAGHLNRDDLRGLATFSARELTRAMLKQMKQVDDHAYISKAPAKSVAKAKSFVAKAGKITAKNVREGKVATKHISIEVHSNAYADAAKAHKAGNAPLPQFKVFADTLVLSIRKMIAEDASYDKLVLIAKVLGEAAPIHEDDHLAVLRIQNELEELGKRANRWAKKMTPATGTANVVPLKQLERM